MTLCRRASKITILAKSRIRIVTDIDSSEFVTSHPAILCILFISFVALLYHIAASLKMAMADMVRLVRSDPTTCGKLNRKCAEAAGYW